MIRFLLRLVLVLVLIAALLIGMTCCAAKAVFGVQQTVRNLEDFFLWLRDVWTLAREKLELCAVIR